MTDSIQFGDRLRELRERAKLSKAALSRRSGISKQFLGDLERGRRSPSLAVAKVLATALGVRLSAWEAE